MIRLYVVAEGATEVDFVTRILLPHIESHTERAVKVERPPNLGAIGSMERLKNS